MKIYCSHIRRHLLSFCGVATKTQKVAADVRRVGLKAPQLVPVLRYASDGDTRRRVKQAAASRCKQSNGPLLERMVDLRQTLAQLLGFDSHAHFQLSSKMAATPAAVNTFLRHILVQLQGRRDADVAKLAELKNQLVDSESKAASPHAKRARRAVGVEDWDTAYFARILKEREFAGYDEEKVREYFPLAHVVEQTLCIYQELLGVRFAKVEDAVPACIKLMHSLKCFCSNAHCSAREVFP